MSWNNKFTLSGKRFWDILILEVFLVMFVYLVFHPLVIDNDASLYLNTGQLLLQGKLPYVDFVEINPPLIMYLSVIPAIIARFLQVNVILVFLLLVSSLIIWSTLTIAKILPLLHLNDEEEKLGIIFLLWVMLSFPIIYGIGDFGQREHLFILSYFPFFLLRWARWERKQIPIAMSIIVAIAAGLGASLKPHFILVVLAPELYWSISKRNIHNLVKIETVTFFCVVFAYAAHFLVLPNEVKEEFFGRWMPLIVQGYTTYFRSLSHLVTSGVVNIKFAFVTIALPFLSPIIRKDSLANIGRPLAIFTLFSVFIYFIQNKGWAYQFIPALFGVIFIWAITIIQIVERFSQGLKGIGLWPTLRLTAQVVSMVLAITLIPVSGMLYLIFAMIFLLVIFSITKQYVDHYIKRQNLSFGCRLIQQLVVLGVISIVFATGYLNKHYTIYLNKHYTMTEKNPFTRIISDYSKKDDPVLFISTTVGSAYPLLVQMDRRPGSRFLWTFPIAMLYNGIKTNADNKFPYRTGKEVPEEETRFLRELAEDINTIKPRLIFIDNDGRCHGCPKGFDIMQYLTQVGLIEGIMGEYRELSTESGFKVFVRSARIL